MPDHTLNLTDDEVAYVLGPSGPYGSSLANNSRCDVCGHLILFHNYHCCEFCLIPGCRCRFGELQPEKP